jgi:hypothetical protein
MEDDALKQTAVNASVGASSIVASATSVSVQSQAGRRRSGGDGERVWKVFAGENKKFAITWHTQQDN